MGPGRWFAWAREASDGNRLSHQQSDPCVAVRSEAGPAAGILMDVRGAQPAAQPAGTRKELVMGALTSGPPKGVMKKEGLRRNTLAFTRCSSYKI